MRIGARTSVQRDADGGRDAASLALVSVMDDSHDLVVRTIREHSAALLRTARRHSLCADDAHDAYQRAIEIFLRRASSLEPATVDRWLHVVVKHEAQAVRRARLQLVASDEVDLDGQPCEALPDADERLMRYDRLSRSAEALQRLKPQEVTALWLKAQGLSYMEIAERQSWTYTKVNRCLTEGRRAFLERYAGIETGEECRRWAPVLSALVDGEATAEQLAAARPHLRRCSACRATLRELHSAGPRMAGVLPGPVAAGLSGSGVAAGVTVGTAGVGGGRFEMLVRGVESAAAGLHERLAGWAVKVQMAGEVAAGGKMAAVAASAAALAGGGAVTLQHVRGDRPAARESRTAVSSPARAGQGAAGRGMVALRPGIGLGGGVVALRPAPGAAGSGPGSAGGNGGRGRRADRQAARAGEFGGGAAGGRGGGNGVREFRPEGGRARAAVSEFRAARSAGRAAGGAEFGTSAVLRALSRGGASSPTSGGRSATTPGGSSATTPGSGTSGGGTSGGGGVAGGGTASGSASGGGREFSPRTSSGAGSSSVERGTARAGEFGG